MAAPSVHLDLPGDVEKATGPHHVEKATGPHHTEKAHRPTTLRRQTGPTTLRWLQGARLRQVQFQDDVEMADGGPQHTEKVDTPHHTEKVDRPHHTEKVDTPHHTEKVDRPHHNEVAAGSQTQTSPVPSSPSRVGKCKNHRLAFTTVSTLDKCFQCVGPVSSLKWLGYKCKDSIVLSDHEPKENESDSDDCESAEADSTVADQAHANEGFGKVCSKSDSISSCASNAP
ncbi:hypothetical protein INR49_025558, partial [Caranx melampygus]